MKLYGIFPALIFILSSCLLRAQAPDGKFEDWGKVTMDEMKMTECSFDKNADAILLLDLAEVYYIKEEAGFYTTGKFRITTAYYQRFKVLTEKGTDRADFTTRFNSKSREDIKNIKAYSYNLENGEIKKMALQPTDIHYSRVNEYETQVSFSVPSVKKGSVFEIGYDKTQYLSSTLPNWYFTSSVASLKSSITVGFLDAIDYYVNKHIQTNNYEERTTPFTSQIDVPTTGGQMSQELTGNAITYTTYNLPGFAADPYFNSTKNCESWMGFQLRGLKFPLKDNHTLSTFEKLQDYLYASPNFEKTMDIGGLPKKVWKSILTDGMTEEQKVDAIYKFISSNITASGSGIYPIENTSDNVWLTKTGTISEVNMLLINTLRKADIVAYPMLVGTRTNGYMNTDFPILDQFKKIVVLVSLDYGKKRLVLDASESYPLLGVTEFELLNTEGLVFKNKSDLFWYHISDQSLNNNTSVLIDAALDNSGRMTGEIIISNDYYISDYFKSLKAHNKDGVISDHLKKTYPM